MYPSVYLPHSVYNIEAHVATEEEVPAFRDPTLKEHLIKRDPTSQTPIRDGQDAYVC